MIVEVGDQDTALKAFPRSHFLSPCTGQSQAGGHTLFQEVRKYMDTLCLEGERMGKKLVNSSDDFLMRSSM